MLLSITLSYFMELWNSGNFAINVWKDRRLKSREGLWYQTDLCRTLFRILKPSFNHFEDVTVLTPI